MIVQIQFEREWIYGDGGANSFAVSRFIKLIHKQYENIDIEVLDREVDRCVLKMDTGTNQTELAQEMKRLLTDQMKIMREDVWELSVRSEQDDLAETDEAKAENSATDHVEEKEEQPADALADVQKSGDVLKRIDQMIGAEDFKMLCRNICERAKLIHANQTEEIFFSEGYLFSINQGEGYSYSLDLFRDLLVEAEFFLGKKTHEIKEVELPAPTEEKVGEKMQHLVGSMDGRLSSENIMSYDLSEWIGHTSKSSFKNLLLSIFRNNRNCVHVFRIPVVSDKLLNQTKEDLGDVLSVKSVLFPPFTSQEQHLLAENILGQYSITVDQNAWDLFDQRIAEERADGYFYGIHTLQKVTNEMVRHLEAYNVEKQTNSKLITPEKIEPLTRIKEAGGAQGEQALAEMIGMDRVKEQVYNIIRQIEFSRGEAATSRPTMHMCFVGNPGTGKTTVARLLGEILNEKGLLRVGKFYEYRGRDLCGRFVGETAIKTTEICKEAYGSILFIDEAYSLYRGDFSTADYGREVLDTLIAEMENHSDDLIVILAGYPNDMEHMLSGNVGLRSRIPYMLEFPNYSREELFEIFMHRTRKDFVFDASFEERCREYFMGLSEEEISARDFGNARFTRNLYERMWGAALSRIAQEGGEEIVCCADFDTAVRDMSHVKPQEKRIGF